MSTYNFSGAQYQAESMAVGAAIGVGMFAVVGAIASVIQAHQAMAQLERRMQEWNNPGLIYEPIRREFLLAHLSEAEDYLFTRLPSEIETLRRINIDLHRITAEPFAVYDALQARIMQAGEGLADDEKAHAFAKSVDERIPAPTTFDPATSPLHQPIEGLDLMRRQHDWLTRSVRGPVYGGSYDQPSDQRDKSASAMWLELREGKERMEAVAQGLCDENRGLVEELECVKASFRGLIALYELAVLAYNSEASEEAVTIFADLFGLITQGPSGFTAALNEAERIAARAEPERNTTPA